jgi:hypothetical protein
VVEDGLVPWSQRPLCDCFGDAVPPAALLGEFFTGVDLDLLELVGGLPVVSAFIRLFIFSISLLSFLFSFLMAATSCLIGFVLLSTF